MDKYEFTIKADQIRKLTGQGDYKTAMQIADTIDWRRVRNANMLSSVAEIYEQNGEYGEAKDILLQAFERSPVGKRFLFRLSELCVKAGELQEAQEFYRSFCETSPEDARQYLLRYQILKAKGARAEQLVGSLEQYTSEEIDEKWLYELAKLYSEAGMEKECIRTCDKIMLLFGLGKYVDKAMELKLQYAPLSKEQMDLVENREKYEDKLRRVAQEYEAGGDYETPGLDFLDDQEPVREEHPSEPKRAESVKEPEMPGAYGELFPEAAEKESFVQEEAAASFSEGVPEAIPEKISEKTSERPSEGLSERPAGQENAEMSEEVTAAPIQETMEIEKPLRSYHMIIEAGSREAGFRIAVDEIKYFHEKYGLDFKVARTSAEKLNEKGFAAFAERLSGRDLIIEEAGKLKYSVVDEITEYILHPEDESSVILVDITDHFDRMAEEKPYFIRLFDLVSDPQEERKAPEPLEEGKSVEEFRPEAAERASAAAARPSEEDFPKPVKSGQEEMSIDDFATYAQEYAKSIDCVLPGKTVLALYERIELMEEDGVVLNRQSAQDLIEEAADKAEKPSLGKKLAGMFHPKYDKDDKLILREENFIS